MWLDEQNKDENKQQTPLENPTIGAGGGATLQPTTTGTTSTPSSLSPVTPTAQTQKPATIQDYFKGSQAQGEQLGSRFTSKLGETKQQKEQQIGEAAAGALGDVSKSTIGFDEQLVSTAVQDPTQIAGNESNFNKFLQQWNAAYKGPESFEQSGQYAQASKAALEAQQKADQLKSTGGRQQLIQDEFGVYGQGNKGLDEALLQQSSYFPKLQEQSKEFGTLQDYFKKQAETVNKEAQAAKSATQDTRTKTQQAFTGQLGKFKEDLMGRTKAQQEQEAGKAQAYQAALTGGDASAVEKILKDANVPENEIKNISSYLQSLNKDYSSSPSLARYYDFNPLTNINISNVARPEDYAKAEAYQKLTGVDYSGVLGQGSKEQAGTAPTAESGFQSPKLSEYLKTNLAQQDQALLSKDLRVDNPATRKPADNLEQTVDKYLNAAQRTGSNPLDVPTIKRMYDSAKIAYVGGLRGGLPAGHPDLAAYDNIIKKIEGTTSKPTQPAVSPEQPQVNPGPDSIVPTEPVAPITVTTPGLPDATNRSGNTVTNVPSDTLIGAKPIDGVSDQSIDKAITTKIDTLKRTDPRNYTNSLPQLMSDQKVMKDLYKQYSDRSITAQNYVQLQSLLKKYGLVK